MVEKGLRETSKSQGVPKTPNPMALMAFVRCLMAFRPASFGFNGFYDVFCLFCAGPPVESVAGTRWLSEGKVDTKLRQRPSNWRIVTNVCWEPIRKKSDCDKDRMRDLRATTEALERGTSDAKGRFCQRRCAMETLSETRGQNMLCELVAPSSALEK